MVAYFSKYFPILLIGALSSAPAAAHEWLPLGDGRVAEEPRSGYVFACPSDLRLDDDTVAGPWISGDRWTQDGKAVVEGDVPWPDAALSVVVEDGRRIVTGNNLPSHHTGIFPIQPDDPAYQYDRNPNPVGAQDVRLDFPAVPQLAAQPSCVPFGAVGFALTGVAIYDPLDAFFRDGPAHEVQDSCNGHPDPISRYHYHGWSPCIPDSGAEADGHSDLAGYILDGFGIYGPNGEDGKPLATADLDECHGHTHEIVWDGKPVEMYHYHFTADFPYTISCYRGTPIQLANDGRGTTADAAGQASEE